MVSGEGLPGFITTRRLFVIQMIKLAKLQLSTSNVRKSAPALIDQFAADIEARGILQNLLVASVTKPRGHFEVFGGGRRLKALLLLLERGRIDGDYEVPCKVIKADDATLSETSLAENFQRLAMTPADECRAFQHFLGTDGDVDAVANRFGVTRRFVDGRLRLANLAEPVFEALANGDMTLDMAKAYASTEDTAKQQRIFEQYARQTYVTADNIRRAIANDTMKATDPIALLIGADAYGAAGGRISRDLFSEDGDRWLDPEVAQGLASVLMETEAKRIGDEMGLAWIRPIATTNLYGATADLHRVQLPNVPFSEEEQAHIDTIEARCEDIGTQMENEELDDDAYTALNDEFDRLESERDELHRRPIMLPDDLKGQVGCFLMLDHKGKLVLETTYFSETRICAGDSGDDASTIRGGRAAGELPPEAVAPGGKPLSARLHDELTMQRRDILAASILADPALALDYALFSMIDAKRSYGQYGTTITAGRASDPCQIGEVGDSQARAALAEAEESLDATWTEATDVVERFEAFRALADDAKAGWLAFMVASSLESKPGYATTTHPLHARLASILEIDVARWWRPTAANFFDRVSKGTLLALLGTVGGPALSTRYTASKKGEVSTSCERLFAGEAITEAETKEAALAWVPDAMRFIESDAALDLDSDEEPGDDVNDDIDLGAEPDDAVNDDGDDIGDATEMLVAAE